MINYPSIKKFSSVSIIMVFAHKSESIQKPIRFIFTFRKHILFMALMASGCRHVLLPEGQIMSSCDRFRLETEDTVQYLLGLTHKRFPSAKTIFVLMNENLYFLDKLIFSYMVKNPCP